MGGSCWGKDEFCVIVKFISGSKNSHQKGRNMPVMLREVGMSKKGDEAGRPDLKSSQIVSADESRGRKRFF